MRRRASGERREERGESFQGDAETTETQGRRDAGTTTKSGINFLVRSATTL